DRRGHFRRSRASLSAAMAPVLPQPAVSRRRLGLQRDAACPNQCAAAEHRTLPGLPAQWGSAGEELGSKEWGSILTPAILTLRFPYSSRVRGAARRPEAPGTRPVVSAWASGRLRTFGGA